MPYRNLGPSRKFPSKTNAFWEFEVRDATGTWYLMDGIWAQDEARVIPKAEKIAADWSTYKHDPVASAKMVEGIESDYATRTYHGD